MWYWAVGTHRRLDLLLQYKVAKDMNPTQAAVLNAKQIYLWVVLAFAGSPSSVVSTSLLAFIEVMHCFKSAIFLASVIPTIFPPPRHRSGIRHRLTVLGSWSSSAHGCC
jgi:hypothetical protein